jgi:hypothetical protein
MRKTVLLISILLIASLSYSQSQTTLDSLRTEVERVISDNKPASGEHIRLLYRFLFEAKTAHSKKDIILAYQQMATRSYATGNTSDALKYYKLYVIELEELSNIEVNRSLSFEKNLYENEIRALNSTIRELEQKIVEIENDKGKYQEVTEVIYLGLRIILVIGALLLIGWLFARYRRPKNKNKIEAEPISNHEQLTEVLNKTKKELVKAETALDLSDILVNKIIPKPDEFFDSNKSIRKKFLLYQPMKLSGGAGLFMVTKKNVTIVATFNSLNAGAAGGLLSSNVYQLLDEIVNHLNILTPSIILKQLESKIKELFPAGIPFSGGVNAGVIAYDSSEKTISYSGANFPLFRLANGEIQKYAGQKNSLLVEEESREFGNEVTDIAKGMRFYLSADSFWSQHGGHDYKPLGEAAFVTAIESLAGQSIEQQSEVLAKIYAEWLGGGDQEGDLLVFGCEF